MLNDIQTDAKTRMEKTISALENSLSKTRAGRAHPSLLDQIQVEYYGSNVPISQVSNIVAEDARTLKVTPWEKNMVRLIEKAIMTSDLGLNPQTMGDVMRIPLPALTEERRRDFVKIVKDEAEHSKVAIRNIRRDANSDFKELLKEKEISEDAARKAEELIQKTTDEYIKIVENKLEQKIQSLLEV